CSGFIYSCSSPVSSILRTSLYCRFNKLLAGSTHIICPPRVIAALRPCFAISSSTALRSIAGPNLPLYCRIIVHLFYPTHKGVGIVWIYPITQAGATANA
ncbi:MAG: hypothetical protein IKK15_01285, partial [Akkermansia sp.]|nr:hypothetical protein [Akkermansia sp.]